MRAAATFDVTIPEDRELRVALPNDVPTGAARVIVLVEELGVDGGPTDEPRLSDAEQDALWSDWLTSGPQGPITDEEAGIT